MAVNSTQPRLVVIGGGATGTGIARLAAEQGIATVLVERGAMGSGTSGRFHGMLHSGARYALNDPAVAADCYQQNQLLRQLMPGAISDTGGMFVALDESEAAHAQKIMAACRTVGIPCQEITRAEALQREPQLNPALQRAFTVPDAFIDGEQLLRLNYQAAKQAATPARFLPNHQVVAVQRSGATITGVIISKAGSRTTRLLRCDYVINAAGVWAPEVADLAGVHIPMVFDKGSMIIFNGQLTTAVINRCRPEADGDLLVPHAGQSIMGTTSRVITDPDDCYPTQEEADVLVREGARMVPAVAHTSAYKIYAGVRPLQPDHGQSGRQVSRSFAILDHDLDNFISVIGGKVTLHRHMAEAALQKLHAQ